MEHHRGQQQLGVSGRDLLSPWQLILRPDPLSPPLGLLSAFNILFHDQILPKVLCNQNKLFKYEVYFCFHHDSESKMIKLLEELNRINKKSPGTIIICNYISLNNPFGILLASEDICYKYYFLYVQVIFKHLLKLLVDQYQMLGM